MIYKNALITTKDEQFLGWIEIDENNILISINKGITNEDGIDCQQNILMPGFIDSHTHGAYGFSFDEDIYDLNFFQEYLENMKSEGIVGIVGTTVTSKIEKLTKNLEQIKTLVENNQQNLPKILSWYFEGPFISKAKKGAHEEELIIPLDQKFLDNVLNVLKIKNVILTVDVEDDINKKLIQKNQDNFIFALGHSNANYDDSSMMLKNGIKRITHLYNAMSGFSHSKNLGILNAMFNKEFEKNLLIEIIADGVHVSDEVIKYTYNNFSIDNLSLVTDSLSPKGLSDGPYKLGNLDIDKKGNWFYLKNSETLSGSAISYNWLLKHFKQVTNCSWSEIVKVSSYNSARNLFLPNNYGDFVIGKRINFVLIDKDFNVKKTII